MDLTIIWLDTAVHKLEAIFDFYKITANVTIAEKIVSSIVDATLILSKQPNIGQVEPLLKNRKNQYRYLVFENFKIIYWVDKPYVNIATVFDCRQNPIKLTV